MLLQVEVRWIIFSSKLCNNARIMAFQEPRLATYVDNYTLHVM
jgi:hypothetical protein